MSRTKTITQTEHDETECHTGSALGNGVECFRERNREMGMQIETISKGETRYLTVTQLAERLQISESTIYGWVDRDHIPFLNGRGPTAVRSACDRHMDDSGRRSQA